MLPHQERVVVEKKELDEKLEKLKTFFDNPIYKSLNESERELLYKQSRFMQGYSDILGVRIANFG